MTATRGAREHRLSRAASCAHLSQCLPDGPTHVRAATRRTWRRRRREARAPPPGSPAEESPTASAMMARRRRFTRLRTTAPPTALETAKPAMLEASPVCATYTTTVRPPASRSATHHDPKVLAASQARGGRQHLTPKSGAAPAATGRQNGASRTGAHAQAEAVRLGTLSVVRLESPLAHGSTPTTFWGMGKSADQRYALRWRLGQISALAVGPFARTGIGSTHHSA